MKADVTQAARDSAQLTTIAAFSDCVAALSDPECPLCVGSPGRRAAVTPSRRTSRAELRSLVALSSSRQAAAAYGSGR